MFDSPASLVPELTDRQLAVLEVVRSYASEHGYPPTVREIGAALGLASSSTVHSHLAALERAGIIERDPTKPRALKFGPNAAAMGIDDAQVGPADGARSGVGSIVGGIDVEASVNVPLIGRVAAGAPILAEEHVEQYVPVPKQLTKRGTSFLLKVSGDSMVDAGILDGDWVVVHQQGEARDGEIVVALVGDEAEATCKRLGRIDGRVALFSENQAYEPIVPDVLSIVGMVTGVMRAI
ncbi:MAG: SOS-response transcriptional repressor, LexA [Thermoleophilia bacterium]|nr:SOS-response transcriptional repressor, LexA [Thermoleophilia bacterium]